VNNWVWKNSSQQTASVHFVFGLLKLAGQLFGRELVPHELPTLAADGLLDLSEKLRSFSFDDFMFVPISYQGREPITICSLIWKIEGIGAQLLRALSIPIVEAESDQRKLSRKEQARLARERALKQFVDIRLALPDVAEALDCSFCHTTQDDFLCYPICTSETAVPSILLNATTEGGCDIISCLAISLCTHTIHRACCRAPKRFHCGICKCRKTGLLLMLSLKRSSEVELSAIKGFFESCAFEEGSNPPSNGLNSLVGLLQAVEIRSRNSPNVLRKDTLHLLIKNLFLAIHHLRKNQQFEKPLLKTIEYDFLVALVGTRNVEDQFWQIASEYQLSLPFACLSMILSTCVLGKPDAADWNAILEPRNMEKFMSPIRIENLMTWTVQLPRGFEQLFPEYPIQDQNHKLALCLLRKTRIAFNDHPTYLPFEVFMEKNRGVTLLLLIAGKEISAVDIADPKPSLHTYRLQSVYENPDGNQDIGFQGLFPLSLSQTRLDRYLDTLVTGDWMAKP
jgi:hypothetical protein